MEHTNGYAQVGVMHGWQHPQWTQTTGLQQTGIPTLNQRVACSVDPMQLRASTVGTVSQPQYATHQWQPLNMLTAEKTSTEDEVSLNQRLVAALAQRQWDMECEKMQFQAASLGTARHKARPTCKAAAAPAGDSKLIYFFLL